MSIASSLADTNTRVANDTSKVFNNGDKKPGQLGGITDSISGIQKNVAGTIVGGGNIVARAAGALGATGISDALTGKQKAKYSPYPESKFVSGLKGFYSQFASAKMNSIDRIDPLNTFECMFKFYPNLESEVKVT